MDEKIEFDQIVLIYPNVKKKRILGFCFCF